MKIGDAIVEVEKTVQRAAVAAKAVAVPEVAAKPVRQLPAAPHVEIRLRSINKSLQFRVDQATGEMIVTIRDEETGEVIRQVPGEDALRIAQRIEDTLSAMLDEKA